MTNSNATTTSNDYFNLHMEGCGNLYDARLVEPKGHQRFTPFLSVRVALLHGPSSSPDALFVDLKVVGAKAQKIVEKYMDDINSSDVKTFAAVKFGDIGIAPNTQAPEGYQQFYVKGRLVHVKYLKVGDTVIDLEKFDEQLPQGDNVPAAANVDAKTDTSESSDSVDAMPAVVKLDKSAPDFDAQKQALKAQGYKWDNSQKVWVAPTAEANAA